MPLSKSIPKPRPPLLRLLALQVAKVYNAVHRFLAWVTGRLGKPMTAEIYFASPVKGGVAVKGRVLLTREWREPDPQDPTWINLIQMLKRWATPERPKSLVRLSLEGEPVEMRADHEGYFETVIPESECHSQTLVVEFPESEVSLPIDHRLSRAGPNSDFLLISDIDDTVLVTNAARRLQMIATTLFGNALTRQLYPGSAALYRALQRGGKGGEPPWNPIAYVTSSPYNLHGLLQLIFEKNGLPLGLFFMTDWGLDVDKWFKKSHHVHKGESIEQTLAWYPDQPVILIGDSGQHDTSIYIDVALAYPERIDLILIRDVSGRERRRELQENVAHLAETPTAFAFFTDSVEAAQILHERGWLVADQVEMVRRSVAEPDAE
ncbi:MAG: DUF2183 domain-containing protein [Verrucomicrobiae bacterium]|nr:DUF2183 domain-containing protein [Verrucomicrobiae bacterium]